MMIPVSVIIPCYRCADTIGRALESVRRQTALPQEVWLIEDCSDDDGRTLAELNRLQQLYRERIKIGIVALERNVGPGEARNAGWARAQQPYIAFLDADDSWHTEKLRIQHQWMVDHPEVVMSGHRTQQLAAEPTPPLPDVQITARRVDCRTLLLRNQFPTRSVMLRRELPYRFAPGKRHAEDFLLWLQIVCNGGQAWHLELPLAYSHRPDFVGGLSGSLWAMEKGELDTYDTLRRQKKLSAISFVLLAAYSLLKFLRRAIRTAVHADNGKQQR